MAAISPNPPNARRQSSGGRRLSGWRPEDVENLFDENDDEEERLRAAKEAEEQRKLKKVKSPFRETPGHDKRRAVYQEAAGACIQMAAENVRATDSPDPRSERWMSNHCCPPAMPP